MHSAKKPFTRRQATLIRNSCAPSSPPNVLKDPASWKLPQGVMRNMNRSSESPLAREDTAIHVGQQQPSSPKFQSFISDFLSNRNESTGSSTVQAGNKFQYKRTSNYIDFPGSSEVLPRKQHNEVADAKETVVVTDVNETIVLSPEQQIEYGDEEQNDKGSTEFQFGTQINNDIPLSSPSSPKIPRLSPTTNRTSEDISGNVDTIKDFTFDVTQMNEQRSQGAGASSKSFTQDIVIGLLNTQSDFFDTQMGKSVNQESSFVANSNKRFSSVGTMTDGDVALEFQKPVTAEVCRHRQTIRTVIDNLHRANAAIVNLITHVEKSTGRSFSSTSRQPRNH